MSEEKEKFLDRWSRLKQNPAKPLVEKKEEEKPLPVLPRIEDLKPDSDFTPFMDPRIDKETRREALKKLFADAQFNVPDAFEPYSRNFNEDPIPHELLKKLEQARRLVFDEKETVAGEAKEEVAEKAKETLPEAKDAAGKQDA